MTPNLPRLNFTYLARLGIITPDGHPAFANAISLISPPFMNLNLNYLHNKSTPEHPVISIAHNFIQIEDVMADPYMEIEIHPEDKSVEACTFQVDSMEVYDQVYDQDGHPDELLQDELNIFLHTWLINLLNQGFDIHNQRPQL